MADQYSETSNRSWLGRLGSSIKGMLVGGLMVVIAFPVLFWNEGRAVKTYKTLKEGSGAVISVVAEPIDPANEGKLVHVTGPATTTEVLKDTVFDHSGALLRLKRKVEMFQWDEDTDEKTTTKLGGAEETTTVYTYKKVWSDDLIDSSDFKQSGDHMNPSSMPYPSVEWITAKATLGAFVLSTSLIEGLNDWTHRALPPDQPLPAVLAGKGLVEGNGYFVGANPATPQVGDLRITFEEVEPCEVSVVSAQRGNSFDPYVAKAGGTIEMIDTGVLTAAAMFQTAQEVNTIITWLVRLGGFLLMMIGFMVLLKPLSVLGDVIPFLGKLIEAGTGLIAFLVSVVGTTVTIAVAWIFYRPVLGIALLGVAGFCMWRVKGRFKPAESGK